jgi:outer membrane protein OmpA-like peptidoglycan-associated protein
MQSLTIRQQEFHMSSSLVMGLTDIFKSQVLTPFAARSGESESSVLRGFEASISAMVAGLASKLGQSGYTPEVLELINDPANDTHLLENARGLVGGDAERQSVGLGTKLTSMLFGGRLSGITTTISNVAGLRTGTVSSLISLGAPLLLGLIGKRVREGGMDRSRLIAFMSQEAAGVREGLPPGVGNLLADGEAPAIPPVASGIITETPKSSMGWIWPVLAAVALVLGLIWWFLSSRPQIETAAANFVTRVLPGNLNLHIPVGRMEDKLLAWIQDPSKTVEVVTWFDFDRLLFDTNSATLQPSSQEQLINIATILKAYPNVHIKIGGYTDNTGDPSANQALSQQRAESVERELVGMGISADRMEAQGYGDEHPVGDNATEAGRQLNRRISLWVTQK